LFCDLKVNVGVLSIYDAFLGLENHLKIKKKKAKKIEDKEDVGEVEPVEPTFFYDEYSPENTQLRNLLINKFLAFFTVCREGLFKLIELRNNAIEKFSYFKLCCYVYCMIYDMYLERILRGDGSAMKYEYVDVYIEKFNELFSKVDLGPDTDYLYIKDET
jgi:hypothetical protein